MGLFVGRDQVDKEWMTGKNYNTELSSGFQDEVVVMDTGLEPWASLSLYEAGLVVE